MTTRTEEATKNPIETVGTAEFSAMLVERFGDLRDRVRNLDSDVAEGHMRALRNDLDLRTNWRAKQSPMELLEGLADRGFSWTNIARLLGVSTSGIRKWRRGEDISGPSRRSLSKLAAFSDMLEESFGIADIDSWMEMPLAEPYEVSGIDVYADHSHGWEVLTQMVIWPVDPTSLLDQDAPGWRDTYAPSGFTVTHDEQGRPTITQKVT